MGMSNARSSPSSNTIYEGIGRGVGPSDNHSIELNFSPKGMCGLTDVLGGFGLQLVNRVLGLATHLKYLMGWLSPRAVSR